MDRKDIEELAFALDRAQQNGLLYEVLCEIFPEPLENMDDRVRNALYEWDII